MNFFLLNFWFFIRFIRNVYNFLYLFIRFIWGKHVSFLLLFLLSFVIRFLIRLYRFFVKFILHSGKKFKFFFSISFWDLDFLFFFSIRIIIKFYQCLCWLSLLYWSQNWLGLSFTQDTGGYLVLFKHFKYPFSGHGFFSFLNTFLLPF